jgi:hypothetical protein
MPATTTPQVKASSAAAVLESSMGAIVLLGLVVFQIQAYFVLYSTASHYLALWAISIGVAVFCSIGTVVQVVSSP